MKFLSRFYIFLVFALLYAPILIVILFSFNEAGDLNSFTGFSLKYYIDLFETGDAFGPLKNSLILALTSSAAATVLGTLGAFAVSRAKSKQYQKVMESVTNSPMMSPDIVTGVSLMLLFVGVGTILGMTDVLSFWTMLLAHTTFNLPYVFLSVLPKFRQMDKHLTEAALDLGCTPAQTFLKVELPSILPGVLSGFMMGFTLSLDDFVISHFVSNSDFVTLPLYIYNQTAHNIKSSTYALCTLMIVAITLLLLAVNLAGAKGEGKQRYAKGGKTK